jgi:hypothetical protein
MLKPSSQQQSFAASARIEGVPEAYVPTGTFGIGEMRVEQRDAALIGQKRVIHHQALSLVPTLSFDAAQAERDVVIRISSQGFFLRAG